jgi:hypothetical protein
MRIRQRVEEALERDGRGPGEEATVDDRERSGAYGRASGEEWRKRGGGQPAEKKSEKRLEAGRESDEAVGAVAQHATVTAPSESEIMRDEMMGAVAQHATASVPESVRVRLSRDCGLRPPG